MEWSADTAGKEIGGVVGESKKGQGKEYWPRTVKFIRDRQLSLGCVVESR